MEAKKTRAGFNQLPDATGQTVAEYERTLTALAARLIAIKRMTEQYPVFLVVAGLTYRFESPDHVDQFVEMLRQQIESYRGRPSAAVV